MNEFLREQMRERGWTIPTLAEACDVAVGLAQRWVSENPRYRVTPSPASCEKIARALGYDPDYVLQLAGHRRAREPRAEVDARRQAIRDQLDRWLLAVGPEYEEYFWRHLKVQGDSTADLIRQLGTAVNESGHAAVNTAVSDQSAGDDDDQGCPDRRLSADQHPGNEVVESPSFLVFKPAAA